MPSMIRVSTTVAGPNGDSKGGPDSEQRIQDGGNDMASPKTKRDRRKVEFFERGRAEVESISPRKMNEFSSSEAAKENCASLVSPSHPVSGAAAPTHLARRRAPRRRKSAHRKILLDNDRIPLKAAAQPTSPGFPKTEDRVLSPIAQLEVCAADAEDALNEQKRPVPSRYPSIFEDYYFDEPVDEPESPVVTAKSPINENHREGEEDGPKNNAKQDRPVPVRQTTAEERAIWGDFWTEGMREREAAKQSGERYVLLQRADTVKVRELLKNRIKNRGGEQANPIDSIQEEEAEL